MDEDDANIDTVDLDIKIAERRYENTKNPMYIWKLINMCRKHNVDIPDVATSYIKQVAERLVSISNPEKRRKNEQIQGDVYRAVFGGAASDNGPSPLMQFWNDEVNSALAMEIEIAMAARVVFAGTSDIELDSIASVPLEELAAEIRSANEPLRPLEVRKGASSLAEAIRQAQKKKPGVSDITFRRLYQKSLPKSDKNPRG